MTNVTFTHGARFQQAPNEFDKKIVTAFVNGNYEDTMVMDASATDEDAMRLYNQRLIEAEETKQAWGW